MLGGLLLGFSSLTRSVLWMFPAVLGFVVLMTWRGSPQRRVLAVCAMLVGFLSPVAPWAVRNTSLHKTVTVIDVMGGRNFMMGNYQFTPLNRAWETIELSGERSWIHVLHDRHPKVMRAGLTQGQIDKLAMREAVAFVLENPGLSIQRAIVKFFNFWGLERELIAGASRSFAGRLRIPAILAITVLVFGSYATVTLGAILGALLEPPRDGRLLLVFSLVLAWICGLHTLAFGHSRYHLPLIPLLAIPAASTVVHWRSIWASRNRRSAQVAFLLSLILITSWLVEIVFVDLERFLDALRAAA
jgi:hypothetical protein